MSNVKKIAIIEDDPTLSMMYAFKLQGSGFDTRTAHDGEQGLILIEEYQPDLILLDLKMPNMSGDQMLIKLRSTERGASIRVIVLTNISKDEAPMGLRLLNIDRYVIKAHHTPSQVVEMVSEILDTKEINNQNKNNLSFDSV